MNCLLRKSRVQQPSIALAGFSGAAGKTVTPDIVAGYQTPALRLPKGQCSSATARPLLIDGSYQVGTRLRFPHQRLA
jgi:hypothetical protein